MAVTGAQFLALFPAKEKYRQEKGKNYFKSGNADGCSCANGVNVSQLGVIMKLHVHKLGSLRSFSTQVFFKVLYLNSFIIKYKSGHANGCS